MLVMKLATLTISKIPVSVYQKDLLELWLRKCCRYYEIVYIREVEKKVHLCGTGVSGEGGGSLM